MQALYYAAMMYLAIAPPAAAIRWDPSMQHALQQARAESKPAFLLYVFGRLDQKFT